MLTHLVLFHAYRLENHVHWKFIFTFLCSCFLRVLLINLYFAHFFQLLPTTNNLCTIISFQEFLSNTKSHLVSSNYFNLIIIICLQLYGFMYSYPILIIFQQINVTHRSYLISTTTLVWFGLVWFGFFV